jgi:microcystin-dependent protein
MVDSYVGEIRMFAGDYAPEGWALCNGATLSIQQYATLFTLIGTTYGGNGTTTFALPDLRGRVNVSVGQGAGLSNHVLGQTYGVETVTLSPTSTPVHTHPFNAANTAATSASPTPTNTMTIAKPAAGNNLYAVASQNPLIYQLNPTDVVVGGGGQPHANIMPVQAVTYIIATQGLFPMSN